MEMGARVIDLDVRDMTMSDTLKRGIIYRDLYESSGVYWLISGPFCKAVGMNGTARNKNKAKKAAQHALRMIKEQDRKKE